MLFFAFAFLATLYSLFLRGHIANAFVGFLDNFVYHDYDRALNVYSMYIRNYMSLFFIVLSLILFAIILRFYREPVDTILATRRRTRFERTTGRQHRVYHILYILCETLLAIETVFR